MKKILLLSFVVASVSAMAQETLVYNPTELSVNNPIFQPQEPTYMHDYLQLGKASQHWFLGAQGSASAFIGNPIGCGDIFDRIKPTWNAYIGKWVTPGFGVRLAFQGSQYKTSDLTTTSFMLGHADLMWNIAETFRKPSENLPRWDFALYVGTGMVRGANTFTADGWNRNFQFAATFGIYTRVRLFKRLFMSGELGGFSTFRSFDGQGDPDKLCDNMATASIGIGANIGVQRWRRAIEAHGYINQNEQLLEYVDMITRENKDLEKHHNMDQKTIQEFKKILQIENLMETYSYMFDKDSIEDKNSYPGLLALKARMEMKQKNVYKTRQGEAVMDENVNPNVIDIPVFFFFKTGKAELSENAQLVNLDEIAKVAKQYNLKVRVASAADSSTGTEQNNGNLSIARSRYIAQQLELRGVKEQDIQEIALGGIAEYEIPKENRYSKVSLYLELSK